jgi:hypothetical protein
VAGGTVLRTFTIYNTGDADLTLTGTPKVAVSGANATDFVVTAQPSSPVTPAGSVTFTIEFNPGDVGIRTASISIENNDPDENPYNFDVQGTGSNNVVFQENFDDGDITNNPTWIANNSAYSVVGGVLNSDGLRSDQSDRYTTAFVANVTMPVSDYMEFSYTGSLKSIGNPQVGRGIHLVLGSNADGREYYLAIQRGYTNGFPTNKYCLSLEMGGDGTIVDLIKTSFQPNYDQIYAIKAIRSDGQWSLYVDGSLIGSVADPVGSFTGISVIMIGAIGSITVDNIYVSTIAPEMDIKGNDVSIADGDSTPSITDDTDFGSTGVVGGTVLRTFTIYNTGDADLTLTGAPKVAVSGGNASDFVVTAQPTSPVAPAGSVTFTVEFDPGAEGLRTATISISNNDPDENPYDFAIQGTGMVAPTYQVFLPLVIR